MHLLISVARWTNPLSVEDGGLGHFHVAAGGNPLCALRPPVVDQTGIKGVFDIKLEWNPDPAMVKNPAENNLARQFFSALQEEPGLRLEVRKVPADVFVIDHLERPVGN